MASPGRKNISEAQLRAAMRKHAAIPALVAKELDCDRTNVVHRIAKSASLQALKAEIEASIEDSADAVIIDTLGRRDVGGRASKDAQNMARWLKDYKHRSKALTMRVAVLNGDGSPAPAAPFVQVEIRYVDPHAEPAADEDVI